MSLQDFLDEVKASGKDSFYLASGANTVRLLTQPIKVDEAFCIAKSKDKKTGEEKVIKRSEIVYQGCGYEKYASPKFVAYAIDSKDQTNEDGTPKIKTLSFGWKVLEGLVAQENSYKEQGESEFTFPMAIDTIMTKSGQGQTNTTYSVAMMINESKNKVLFSVEQLTEALALMPSLRDWKANLIKETQERHAKFGIPKAEKQLKEEEEALNKGGEPSIQLDAEDDVSDDDIPF